MTAKSVTGGLRRRQLFCLVWFSDMVLAVVNFVFMLSTGALIHLIAFLVCVVGGCLGARAMASWPAPPDTPPHTPLVKVDWTLLNHEDREWAEQQMRLAGTEIDGKVELSNGERTLICQRCRYPITNGVCRCDPSERKTCRYCHGELVGVDRHYTCHVRCAVNSTRSSDNKG